MRGGILISAGEASGDLHGGSLARSLKERAPEMPLFGLGGSAMESAGVELIERNDTTGVTGIVEVLSHVGRIYATFHRLLEAARSRRPDLTILIDYPDFNLRLARKLKQLGLRVMYYISPQVWAWRAGRLRQIKRLVDHMAVILPFEEELYRKAGVAVTFVGHPLRDAIHPTLNKREFFELLGLDICRPLIVLLPGSRRKEVENHLGILVRSLQLLRSGRQAVIVRAPTIDPAQIHRLAPGLPILRDRAYDALANADLVLTSCGTATLETALCGTPMVAFYRLSPLTYFLGRPLVRARTFAMCNILAGRRAVPELIQGEFTPERVAAEAERILEGDAYAREMREQLAMIAERLGPPGASARAADLALSLMRHPIAAR